VNVRDPRLTAELSDIFASALDDRTRCWVLHSDGSWVASPAAGEEVRDHQRQMMRRHRRHSE
jgi:polyphosphate kinase